MPHRNLPDNATDHWLQQPVPPEIRPGERDTAFEESAGIGTEEDQTSPPPRCSRLEGDGVGRDRHDVTWV